jgi:hypothetical protein
VSFKNIRSTCIFINAIKKVCEKHILIHKLSIPISILELVRHQSKYGEQNSFSIPNFQIFVLTFALSLSTPYGPGSSPIAFNWR